MSSSELIPSAAAVLLRAAEGPSPFEVLVVRKSRALRAYAGAWVFPGGRVDAAEVGADPVEGARRAAAREVAEETSLRVDPAALRPLARWTTPVARPRRYRAWFFLAEHPGGEVRVDGGEIHEHRWAAPEALLAARTRGAILPPPVFVTLSLLADRPSMDAALALAESGPERFDPRVAAVDGGHASLYEGDAGFRSGDGNAPGARHRLWMTEAGWRYERSD